MINNDVLRRVRYIFDFKDDEMMTIFSLAGHSVSRETLCDWLKNDNDTVLMKDVELASFLNGLIIRNRGKKDDNIPAPEEQLSNNMIFRKIKIALELKDTDILNILSLAGMQLSKHELSAFFRRQGHKNYRNCNDQVLRNFLSGLQSKYRS